MGKQTDLHITTVNGEVAKARQALLDMTTAETAFKTAWGSMMTAYDKSGKTASAPFGNTLKAEETKHEQAIADAKKHLTAADSAVKAFDTFVTQKEKTTINPLKKTSLSKAKKFVAAAKADLKDPLASISTKTSLKHAYDIGVQHYY
jgi:hypothetical protein